MKTLEGLKKEMDAARDVYDPAWDAAWVARDAVRDAAWVARDAVRDAAWGAYHKKLKEVTSCLY
jgi:hypothetical protein